MTTWNNSPANFARSWHKETPPGLVIEQEGTGNDMKVTPTGARGLADDMTYDGVLDTTNGQIDIVFTLKADGIDVDGKKQLAYHSAAESSTVQVATSTDNGDAQWGSDVNDFEGEWLFSGSGKVIIDHETVVQFINIVDLDNLAFRAVFSSSRKELTITFSVANNGWVGEFPANREILYIFPEILQTPVGTPSEGERFEEVGTGGY